MTADNEKDKEDKKPVGYRIDRQSPQNELSEQATLIARAAVDFNEVFLAKLKQVFLEEQWRIQKETNSLIISSLNPALPKQLFIKRNPDGMVFSGSADSEKEIVLAASAYQDACQQVGEKIIFEVLADDENAALHFMAKLHNEGFDIKKISAVTCKGMVLEGKSMKEYTQEMIAKIENSNQPRPKPTPKPPGNP